MFKIGQLWKILHSNKTEYPFLIIKVSPLTLFFLKTSHISIIEDDKELKRHFIKKSIFLTE